MDWEWLCRLPPMELLGRIPPTDDLAPEKLVRDIGRAISVRLAGRSGLANPAETLARLLGREMDMPDVSGS